MIGAAFRDGIDRKRDGVVADREQVQPAQLGTGGGHVDQLLAQEKVIGIRQVGRSAAQPREVLRVYGRGGELGLL